MERRTHLAARVNSAVRVRLSRGQPGSAQHPETLDVAALTSLPSDHDADGAALHVELLDAVAQFKRTADGGVGIKRQQEVLDQEIERAAVDLEARDFHPLDVHCGMAAGGTDARRHAYRPLAVEQLREQPARRMSLRPA